MNAAACMRCRADAAGMASSGDPPTSSQTAIHKDGAVLLGAANVRWCMGSNTCIGGRIGMDFLRWASMLASMAVQ